MRQWVAWTHCLDPLPRRERFVDGPPRVGARSRSRPCAPRRSAKWPTPAWGATTCSRSGSASPTKSRRRSSGRRASTRSNAGETFYTHNLGIPELRDAIASYVTRLHRPTGVDDIAVTNSGMSALMLTTQALVGPGDRVVAVTPLWPNLVEIPKILGARRSTASRCSSAARLDARPRSPARRAHARHARRLHQFAQQSDRLDPRRGRASARSSRTAAGTASGSSPTTPTSACTSTDAQRQRRALVSRSRRPGRSRRQHEHVLEVLADDGMAAGLDRGAARRSFRISRSSSNTTRRAHRLRAARRRRRGERGRAR